MGHVALLSDPTVNCLYCGFDVLASHILGGWKMLSYVFYTITFLF